MFDRPDLLHALLAKTADAVTVYLNAQIARGAQAAMIFDTWGGVLAPANYREFSLAYMQRVVEGLTREAEGRRVPIILFTKNGGQWLGDMAKTGCDALGVDWTTDLADARRLVEDRVALQGNLDPCALYASPSGFARKSRACWRAMAMAQGMCSTLATASRRTSIRSMPAPWWPRSMNSAAPLARLAEGRVLGIARPVPSSSLGRWQDGRIALAYPARRWMLVDWSVS